MLAAIAFEFPLGWLAALPLAAALGFAAWQQNRRGVPAARICSVVVLRGLATLPLVALVARPVWLARGSTPATSRPVVVLLDRSESMSLADDAAPRYQEALKFLQTRLVPAFKSARLPMQAMLFDEGAEQADAAALGRAVPNGKRTNLGGAIAQALGTSAARPLAVVALTDGGANQSGDDTRALSALGETGVPFIGVGFGSDRGPRALSLREVEAPANVPSKTSFGISARLEMINADDLPPFELLLYRDGQIAQKKTVTPGRNSRSWLESFQVTEPSEGLHHYKLQLLPPDLPNLKTVNLTGTAAVRVSDQKELRILYIQGALTWDYKFIALALRGDPTIKLTGLTRTSSQSVFRQNVEDAGELLQGFPTTLQELAPFRAVVLSNLRPADLTTAQQELLARYCGEMGGGLLMIGGQATFDGSWKNSRLEQLLPVVLSPPSGVTGFDSSFHLQLAAEALQNPVFQLASSQTVAQVWASLPAFRQYARVDSAKPGAQVWMVHPTDTGPGGKRILMASQRYGAGLTAVVTVQNFWRWRLSRDADPEQFDRFWRQWFRFLSDVGRQEVSIHLTDQELHPDMDVQVLLEKEPDPKDPGTRNHKLRVRAENSRRQIVEETALELEPLRPAPFKFHATQPGTYTVTVSDAANEPLSSRTIEIRDVNVEFQDSGRNMETLRQWASVSRGLAVKVEECPAAADLVSRIKAKVEEVRHGREARRIAGVNGWVLSLVLGCLSAEWLLRRRWQLA